jgi:hypothetical protein
MSQLAPRLDIRFLIRARFPSEHIQAFGFAEVGPVYLTFAANGTIRKAEAALIDATFKHMLIDSPDILRIFGQRGDSIDMSILHPAAKFRLDILNIVDDNEGELDMTSFDAGRLMDITNLPAATRFGWSQAQLDRLDTLNGGAVHERVREMTDCDRIATRKDSTPKNNLGAIQKLEKTTDTLLPPPNVCSPTRQRRPNTPIPAGVQGQKMGIVYQQILERLPDAAKATYTHYVTGARKEAAKNKAKKLQFHQDLWDFVQQHNIVELHNTYADIQKKSGSNKVYHLPIFDNSNNGNS